MMTYSLESLDADCKARNDLWLRISSTGQIGYPQRQAVLWAIAQPYSYLVDSRNSKFGR
jgi:hypothetical protein